MLLPSGDSAGELIPMTGRAPVAAKPWSFGVVMAGRRSASDAENGISRAFAPLASRTRILPSAVYRNRPSARKRTGNGKRSSPEETSLPDKARLRAGVWYARPVPEGSQEGVVPGATRLGLPVPVIEMV